MNNQGKLRYLLPASILLSSLILSLGWISRGDVPVVHKSGQATVIDKDTTGVILPVKWGDMGTRLIEAGVIDPVRFEELYQARGGLPEEVRNLLYGSPKGFLTMTERNAAVLLNLFWALGLGNKNPILEEGPMRDPRYGGAANFASTGGWTIAEGDTMDHYSRHPFLILSSEDQERVERIAKTIYRPCCNNSTYFPDCNHGMAMLGFLELMASQGVSDEAMYRAALAVNSLWFPDTYAAIRQYKELRGEKWGEVDPREVLGEKYSSFSGYQWILTQVAPPENKSGGSCGV